jgi:hypothetical protein
MSHRKKEKSFRPDKTPADTTFCPADGRQLALNKFNVRRTPGGSFAHLDQTPKEMPPIQPRLPRSQMPNPQTKIRAQLIKRPTNPLFSSPKHQLRIPRK